MGRVGFLLTKETALNIIVGHYGKDEAKTDIGEGYDGWVEPEDRSWILFWDTDGKPELFTMRDENGAVIDAKRVC